MKTILVDDELWALDQFKRECTILPDIQLVGEFTSSEDALEYAKNNRVEFALLDIEMPGMNGVELSKKLRKLYPDMIIVFVTGHKQYLEDFINVKGDYYVVKPYTMSDVSDVISRARLLSRRIKSGIVVRTFGEFQIYIDGEEVKFQSNKAKELLALLIQKRGEALQPQEAMDYLWDGREYDRGNASVYRTTLSRLRATLNDAGIGNILCDSSNGKYIDTDKIECDLYRFFDGDENALRTFSGDYMKGYFWADTMAEHLKDLHAKYIQAINDRKADPSISLSEAVERGLLK